jgi:hypothetical protein
MSFAGTGPKGDILEPYESTPDFAAQLGKYDVLEVSLEPGDCLVFDRLTGHGAPNAQPPSHTMRRLSMRFADGSALYRPQGPWTRDMTDFLERRYGLVEGGRTGVSFYQSYGSPVRSTNPYDHAPMTTPL